MDTRNLKDVAYHIDYFFNLFLDSFPNNKNTKECREFVLKMTMKEGRGLLNPIFVEQMIIMHKKPLIENGFMVELV